MSWLNFFVAIMWAAIFSICGLWLQVSLWFIVPVAAVMFFIILLCQDSDVKP